MDVVVAGQGYVGLPLAVRAAEVGHRVVGYDVDPQRVQQLAAGRSYVEDVASARLRAVLESKAYRVIADADALPPYDVAVITVPTPLRDGVPDLTCVESCAQTIGEHLRPGATVVLESTTYPGTTEELVLPILEKASGLTAGADFHVGFSPERIDPGNKAWPFEKTPKVVSGIDAASLDVVRSFYDTVVEITITVSGTKVAELTKLIENTFRHVNIALVNEMAMLARPLGVSAWEAIDAAASKPFGYMRFTPGPGVGGHCLPIDPSLLSWKVERAAGVPFRFVDLANDVNAHMPDYVVRRLTEAFNTRRMAVRGSRVLLLGLAYKANTSDARESPSVRVAELLLDLGAEVRGADPHVVDDIHINTPLTRVIATAEEIAASDAVVLLTDHAEFDYETVLKHAPYVLDCRNRLSGANVEVL
ncbi:nucleotide sugar dehydrogenase [Streptomyces chumphonensis]|uniref:Nucleotide sugar dehydrogenase n=1 Tax=Streptomyces chumphonensis TaxID=1214925 RepID=A0A927F2A1_9ACTN|nr:nucleotide sugar dehydrogenase [Streptomyces chumphonensis]MBD3932884.1 nucleotide sugar dehydrogenase [Streptomyces chumphonensis]